MACPDTKCVGNAVVNVGPSTFTKADWRDSGLVAGRNAASVPNQVIERDPDGNITRVAGPNYVLQEITVRTRSCSDAYDALWQLFIQGNNCHDSVVVNDRCCSPKSWKDAIITEMDPPDVTFDEAEGTITIQAVPTN